MDEERLRCQRIGRTIGESLLAKAEDPRETIAAARGLLALVDKPIPLMMLVPPRGVSTIGRGPPKPPKAGVLSAMSNWVAMGLKPMRVVLERRSRGAVMRYHPWGR